MIAWMFRYYADTIKASRVRSGVRKSDYGADRVVYNDATASAYQEWNVIKKNKFGRKQDRVIGIDGSKVYNGKRGQNIRVSAVTGVYRAEREIANIRKVDIVAEELDHRTFRINWVDGREAYDIDYTCDTTRECLEIVTKLKYIMKKMQSS